MAPSPRSWRDGLLALLDLVAQGSPTAAGAWQLGAGVRPTGVVLVEDRRVCWATAPGCRRLTDVLIDDHGLGRAEVEEVYARCRAEGRPLGQTLVASGVLSAPELRGALMRQTAEAMVALAAVEEPPRWVPHRGGGYMPTFSFSPLEVALAATSFAIGADPSERGRALAAILGGGWGGAFAPGAPALPVALAGDYPTDLAEVVALGQWAQRVLAPWTARRRPAQLVTWWGERHALVAWPDREGPCAAVCDDPSSVSRLLARHARAREA